MTPTHLDRLTRLANLVESHTEYEINLNGWGCGTTACAIGLAAHSRIFEAEGFMEAAFCQFAPVYRDDESGRLLDGWCAIKKFFGLTTDQVERFFYSSRYSIVKGERCRTELVQRLRTFVAEETRKLPTIITPERAA